MVLKEFRYLPVAKEFRLPHRLHTDQSLPLQQGGEETPAAGRKPSPALIVTLPGRPGCLWSLSHFWLRRAGDQAGNPLPDGSAGRCLVIAALWQSPGRSWLTADQRAGGPLVLFHKILLGQAGMKPSGFWQGCLRCRLFILQAFLALNGFHLLKDNMCATARVSWELASSYFVQWW